MRDKEGRLKYYLEEANFITNIMKALYTHLSYVSF